MNNFNLMAIGAIASCFSAIPAVAATTVYADRGSFASNVGASVTDDYSNRNYRFIQSDSAMSAVLGQTKYKTTGFTDLNIVFPLGSNGPIYCAGCNGSFTLGFESTSLSRNGGIFGVALDVVFNSRSLPYGALVTFGDNSTTLFTLPISSGFFGLSSSKGIKSIDFGPSGGPTRAGDFGIDNLTIAASTAVPEPSTWIMMLLGFGLIGSALRASKRRQKISVSYA